MDNRDLVKANFGRRAGNYRASTVHNNSGELDRMIDLLQLTGNEKGLDVATGAGHTAHQMARYLQSVVAIDLTQEMLAEAKAGAEEKGLGNVEFRLGDVHQLDLPDQAFDVVTSRFAPHHFARIDTALAEMCRVLKPGGKLYILDCATTDHPEAEQKMNRIEWIRDNSHICSYSPRRWQEMLEKLPLELEHFELHRLRYELPQWFDRMETSRADREEIFQMLAGLSTECRKEYDFGEDFMTTYRVELVARRK